MGLCLDGCGFAGRSSAPFQTSSVCMEGDILPCLVASWKVFLLENLLENSLGDIIFKKMTN